MLVFQLILQMFFIIIILQMGGYMPLWFLYNVTRIICVVMSVYLSLNTCVNFFKKKEREVYNDTAFICDRNLFLDNCVINMRIIYKK